MSSFDESSCSYSYTTGTVTEESGSSALLQRSTTTTGSSLGETSADTTSQTRRLRYCGESNTDALSSSSNGSNASRSDFSARVSDSSSGGLTTSSSGSGGARGRGGCTASLSSERCSSREEEESSSEDVSESYVSGLAWVARYVLQGVGQRASAQPPLYILTF